MANPRPCSPIPAIASAVHPASCDAAGTARSSTPSAPATRPKTGRSTGALSTNGAKSPTTTIVGVHPNAGLKTNPTPTPAKINAAVCTIHTAIAPAREAPRPTSTVTTPAAWAMPAGTYFAGWVR